MLTIVSVTSKSAFLWAFSSFRRTMASHARPLPGDSCIVQELSGQTPSTSHSKSRAAACCRSSKSYSGMSCCCPYSSQTITLFYQFKTNQGNVTADYQITRLTRSLVNLVLWESSDITLKNYPPLGILALFTVYTM